jgi:aryl-alcohol dehydrogenase-like predicted oxidoreductase
LNPPFEEIEAEVVYSKQTRPWSIFSPGSPRSKATPAQIALAWLLAKKPWIVPIPGIPKRERLEENIGAVNVELTDDDLGEIENSASKITVQGARYPEQLESLSYR